MQCSICIETTFNLHSKSVKHNLVASELELFNKFDNSTRNSAICYNGYNVGAVCRYEKVNKPLQKKPTVV
ncbi:hypothetical protein D0T85_05060 [Bacteroides sp. 519]|nr:hypothetical protein [Bacteroides sp. 519]